MFSVIYGVFLAEWGESSRWVVLEAKPRDNSIEWRGDSDGMDRTRIQISPREYEEWRRVPLYSQWKWAQVVPETFVSESVGLNNSA
jgi:hypothetical protein